MNLHCVAIQFLCLWNFLAAVPLGDEEKWDVNADHGGSRTESFAVTEGTWINLDVSPNGSEIVLDLLGDLYLLPIGGGEARPLRALPSFDVQPRYSPDGEWISFTSDAGGGDNVWIMRADGSDARAVTKEDFRLFNNAVWTPDGEYFVARKHFTSSRSLGAGEMWMVPRTGGAGVKLTDKRTDQKDAGEPCVSPDGRFLYYSEDVTPGQSFEYNKDPQAGIYAIHQLDLHTGRLRALLQGPGGAVRPQISPDGKKLAFVRRIRFRTALCLYDLEQESVRVLFDGLSADQQETWAIFGVYPGFSWTPDGSSLVIWAQGKILRVHVEDPARVAEIPFHANVNLQLAPTVRHPVAVGTPEFFVHVTRWPSVSSEGNRVVYTALGHTYVKSLPDGEPKRLTDQSALEYHPRFSPNDRFIVQVSFDDVTGGALEIVDVERGKVRRLSNAYGHYLEPAFSPDGQWIVYQWSAGDGVRGRKVSAREGIYIVSSSGGEPRLVTERGDSPLFSADGTRLYLRQSTEKGCKLVSCDLNGKDEIVLASGDYVTDIRLSPDLKYVAFTELFQSYLARFPRTGRAVELSSHTTAFPVRKLSRDAGEFLSWSSDSKVVRWHLAHELYEADAEHVLQQEPTSPPDPSQSAAERTYELGFMAKEDVPETNVVFDRLSLVTMNGDEILQDARLHVQGNRIVALGPRNSVEVPEDAQLIDFRGLVVTPGFVDVHAHMPRGSAGMSPKQSWPLLANLAFGVTTTHDPSADTKMVFSESEMVKAGTMLGPRVFSTGTILYGADGSFKAVINSYQDALSHLRRLKAFGAFSVKSYNQPRRDQRQQILAAARELEMMVVPEGGSTFFHNLNQIIDGHTTIEHALPIAPLYDDVITLFSRSGTAYTPTLIVGYGGIWGENYWYQHSNVWENERLLRFVPRSVVDPRSMRRMMAPENDFHHVEIAKSAAEIVRAGGLAEIGAHGQMQGIGVHWEMWMFAQGGLTNHQVLKVATLFGAKALGLDGDLGSIEPGKLADLAFFAEGRSPLQDIRNSEHVVFVMKGGRMYDAMTLDQMLPVEAMRSAGPPVELLEEGAAGEGASASCHCGAE